jgi:hypothetical protein
MGARECVVCGSSAAIDADKYGRADEHGRAETNRYTYPHVNKYADLHCNPDQHGNTGQRADTDTNQRADEDRRAACRGADRSSRAADGNSHQLVDVPAGVVAGGRANIDQPARSNGDARQDPRRRRLFAA